MFFLLSNHTPFRRPSFAIPKRATWVACCASLLFTLLAPPAVAFDLKQVSERARQLAAAPYKQPQVNLPQEVKDLDYTHFQQINYKPERILWRNTGTRFDLDFFPEGWHFNLPVKINEVTSQGVHEIRYDPQNFNYGSNKINPDNLRNLGFSGFRVHYPINAANRQDEILSFLGASYFRALGKGQHYGLSARGLAIDTAMGSGEEFPRFVEFWVVKPEPSATSLIIYALLDSPRVTGAYRFVVRPGISTTMEVNAQLYFRDKIGKLGMAPLTSMFFFRPGQHPNSDDYRPAVHDSSGLSVHMNNGEWLWRPLSNPKHLLVTSFSATDPIGFGLMQRHRAFADYESPSHHYELRPSTWIEPIGSWGPGRVELVQIPTTDETNDNIVAYWVPDKSPQPDKEPFSFNYRVWWQKDQETRPPGLYVAQTLQGRGYTHNPDDTISLAVDFVNGDPKQVTPDNKPDAQVSVDANAKLLDQTLIYNEATNGWRLSLHLQRLDAGKPVEMRASLHNGNKEVSETWSYILPPD